MTKRNPTAPLGGYEVLLCLSGGISRYKSADLASKLVQAGASVRVAMTEAAARFVAPLTFQALTRKQVFTSMWQPAEDFRSQHISLTELADLMIVAPATADVLGKMACGIADDLVSTLFLSSTGACEVLVAPAMNTRMWDAPAVRENAETLRRRSVRFVGPGRGNLACGAEGLGRMAEAHEIFTAAKELLLAKPPKTAGGAAD
jgi:phosphopantothenoylcysteine decarboxylase/phosphopantothenate--cysteine ligase